MSGRERARLTACTRNPLASPGMPFLVWPVCLPDKPAMRPCEDAMAELAAASGRRILCPNHPPHRPLPTRPSASGRPFSPPSTALQCPRIASLRGVTPDCTPPWTLRRLLHQGTPATPSPLIRSVSRSHPIFQICPSPVRLRLGWLGDFLTCQICCHRTRVCLCGIAHRSLGALGCLCSSVGRYLDPPWASLPTRRAVRFTHLPLDPRRDVPTHLGLCQIWLVLREDARPSFYRAYPVRAF